MKDIWKKCFSEPFAIDSMVPSIIWCGTDIHVTSLNEDDEENPTIEPNADDMQALVDCMNGNQDAAAVFYNAKYFGSNTQAYITFYDKDYDKIVIDIRAWGYLTGTLKMPTTIACFIQDTFAEFIVECMNKCMMNAAIKIVKEHTKK